MTRFQKVAAGQRWLGLPPGTWVPIISDGELTARVACPLCGATATLDHVISEDGTVTPSLLCASDGCDFHDMAVLDRWADTLVIW